MFFPASASYTAPTAPGLRYDGSIQKWGNLKYRPPISIMINYNAYDGDPQNRYVPLLLGNPNLPKAQIEPQKPKAEKQKAECGRPFSAVVACADGRIEGDSVRQHGCLL